MNRRSVGLVAFLAILAGAANVSAGWSHLEVVGGGVYHLISPQPGVAYGGIFLSGVYKTTDHAGHWQGINSGFIFGETLDFVVSDPTNPSVIYAGGGGDGTTVGGTTVSKSSDGGAHWVDASTGLSGGLVSGFAVDPFTPQTLYCGVVGSPYSGIFKSTNGGTKWSPANSGLPRDHFSNQLPSIYSMIADPQTKQRIYALTGAGLMISTDAAVTWTLGGGSFGNLQFASFSAALVRSTSGDLYVLTTSGVFRSADAGAHFNAIGGSLPQGGAVSLASDPRNPAVLYAGESNQIFKSTNTGAAWTESDSGLGTPGKVEALAVDAGLSSVIYAGTDNGAFVSTDSGATWKSSNTGLFATRVPHFGLDAAGGTIFASSDVGPWLSTDGGSGWRKLTSGLPPGISSTPVAVLPESPGTLLIATRPITSSDKPAIYRSTDSGASWQKVDTAASCFSISSFETDPANPSRAFGTCQTSSGNHLLMSTDGGGTWKEKAVTATGAELLVAGGNPSTLLLGDSGGFQASTDGGSTFHPLHVPGLAGFTVVRVAAIAGGPPGILYASATPSSGVGVFRSSDAGLHWSNIGGGLPADLGSFSAMAVDPDDPNTVYGATSADFSSAPSKGFFRSSDGGATWASFNSGLDPVFGVSTLMVSPDGRSLFAGTTGDGLLQLIFGPPGRGDAARSVASSQLAKVGRRP